MSLDRAETFKKTVEEKIEKLLDEFAGGDISREHFDMVYARYSRQLTVAEKALEDGALDQLNQVMREIPTMALNAAIRGIAVGMVIVHHLQMAPLRTFGDYILPDDDLASIIEDIQHRLFLGQRDHSQVEKRYANSWLVVCSLEQTTLITLFRNEPSVKQVQELERRHRDFESANRNILVLDNPDPDTLVYPVELFVRTS